MIQYRWVDDIMKEPPMHVAVDRNLDGIVSTIPLDIRNVDYQAFLAWEALGNTPLPAGSPWA